MAEEFCPECGAKITGNTGFCPECGAVTTSLKNQIEETERIKREEKEKQAERKRQSKEKRINFIKKNKYYLIGLLILIIAVVAVVTIMDSLDTSNKIYDCDEYTLEYPHNYTIGPRDHTTGTTGVTFTDFDSSDSNGQITVATCYASSSSLEDSKDYALDYYKEHGVPVKYKGTKTIDGVKGYVLEYEGHWTSYKFITGSTEYTISFNRDSYDSMDVILDSFKFK